MEGSGIKLSSVVSDLTGVSSRAMLDALVQGEPDSQVLAGLARGPLRSEIPGLVDELTGRFKEHHAFMARLHLEQIDAQSRIVDGPTGRIEEVMSPFRAARDFLATIPAVPVKVADVISAETGGRYGPFRNSRPARVLDRGLPGSNESAGRTKSAHILPGNKYPKAAAPGTAALSASHSKDTYPAAKYRRITTRR